MDGGWQWGSIMDKSLELSSFLEENDLKDVIIVGHSMGGLVAAEAMIRYAHPPYFLPPTHSSLPTTLLFLLSPIHKQTTSHSPTHPPPYLYRGEPRIDRMVAVGVPFHGSYFALVGLFIFVYAFASMNHTTWAVLLLFLLLVIPARKSPLPTHPPISQQPTVAHSNRLFLLDSTHPPAHLPIQKTARQMLPNSDLIALLRPRYPSIAHRVSCIYSPSDNILLSAASALLMQVKTHPPAHLIQTAFSPPAPLPPTHPPTTIQTAFSPPAPPPPPRVLKQAPKSSTSFTPPSTHPPNLPPTHPQDEVAFTQAKECPVLGHAHLLFGDGAHDLIVSELLATPPEQAR